MLLILYRNPSSPTHLEHQLFSISLIYCCISSHGEVEVARFLFGLWMSLPLDLRTTNIEVLVSIWLITRSKLFKHYWNRRRLAITRVLKKSRWKLCYTIYLIWAGMVGAVGKISAFRPQGPLFDSRLCRDSNICATFFSA